jgi:hypothetical protein
MSCCGNNKVDQLKQIYTQSTPSNVSGPSGPSGPKSSKPIIGKGSPFSNNTTDYKPVMSPNGKFVKYIRESKKET